jgi:hypothetical protein
MTAADILNDRDALGIPRFVERLYWEPTIDSAGRDAVYVWLVMPDKMRISPAQFQNLIGASRRIDDAFARSKLDIVPYIRYARRSEMRSIHDDLP